MRIINPSVELMYPPAYSELLGKVERGARTCYKSEDKINEESAEPLIKRLILIGHGSVLEHSSLSVRFICDRGVSHELVRHRLCSISQESTRYCNYGGEKFGREVTFIKPCFWIDDSYQLNAWYEAMGNAEDSYLALLEEGASPQEARSVLPNSLKTEIVVTANIRQWRLIFAQRCDKAAHVQMRQVMLPVLKTFIEMYPVFFEDMMELLKDGYRYFNSHHMKLAEVI